jgi:hypothetical protein
MRGDASESAETITPLELTDDARSCSADALLIELRAA